MTSMPDNPQIEPPAFGTSGLRGLVVALSDDLVACYTRAFVAACDMGTGICLGRDLRASSPRLAAAVAGAAHQMGAAVWDCGALPTPALALAAQSRGAAAIMVTGSHIPDDRNGLKFYTPQGEITKDEERAIAAAMPTTYSAASPAQQRPTGTLLADTGAAAQYLARYRAAFGSKSLAGLRLGIYQHSSVARDLLVDLVTALGAIALPLGRADRFIPLDTEAVDAATCAQLAAWAAAQPLDAILSTDGDGDRPLLADGTGQVIDGDILGLLTARALGAGVICTPISSNSMIETVLGAQATRRCKIGSPYVIAAMAAALAQEPAAAVVGFEANGGFLLGFDAGLAAGTLPALMTRDAALPLIAPLAYARARGQSLAQICAALPARQRAADRLPQIPAAASAALIARLDAPAARAAYLAPFGRDVALDRTDGLRMTLTGGRVLHLRPSGNAPELRIYVEAETRAEAQSLLAAVKDHTATALAQIQDIAHTAPPRV